MQMVIAAGAMAAAIAGGCYYVGAEWPSHQLANAVALALVGGGGTIIYVGILHTFHLSEIVLIQEHLRARLGW